MNVIQFDQLNRNSLSNLSWVTSEKLRFGCYCAHVSNCNTLAISPFLTDKGTVSKDKDKDKDTMWEEKRGLCSLHSNFCKALILSICWFCSALKDKGALFKDKSCAHCFQIGRRARVTVSRLFKFKVGGEGTWRWTFVRVALAYCGNSGIMICLIKVW